MSCCVGCGVAAAELGERWSCGPCTLDGVAKLLLKLARERDEALARVAQLQRHVDGAADFIEAHDLTSALLSLLCASSRKRSVSQ